MPVDDQAGPKSRASSGARRFGDDSRNPWYLVLLLIFSGITALAIVFLRHSPAVQQLLSPIMLLMLGLASYRLGRIMALDEVTQPFRLPFIDLIEVEGEPQEVPRQEGFRGAVGQLLTSPDSVGFWIAGLLVYLFVLSPPVMRMIIVVLAVNGLAELFNAAVHWFARRSDGPAEAHGTA